MFNGKRIVDLTMLINENTPNYPGDPLPKIEEIATIKSSGWNEKRISMNTHFSTHIDAPFHMLEDGKKLSEYPIETFFGDAVVVTLSNFDAMLSDIKEKDFVLFCTGQSKKAFTSTYYDNAKFLTKEIAEKLVAKKIRGIGIDSFSIDENPWPVHKIVFKHNILIIENLMNLEELVGKRVELIALPLKLDNADASPCRAVALI
ncbi:Kynurenine formamidase [uncultured archaeon]|nr:Kynurenine formamidase [uncultured archaeon]